MRQRFIATWLFGVLASCSSSSTIRRVHAHNALIRSTPDQNLLDCTLPPPHDVLGDGSLLLSQIYNPLNQTVTVRFEYTGNAWVGVGYAGGLPFSPMIGLPQSGRVVKYFINGQTPSRVNPGSSVQQTATNTSITQRNGRTILTFTKPVPEDREGSVTVGPNRILWAVGTDNTFTTHPANGQYRGFATTTLTQCSRTVAAPSPIRSPVAPLPTPIATPVVGPTSAAPLGVIAAVWSRIRAFVSRLIGRLD